MLAGDAVPGDETLGCGFTTALDWRFVGEDFGDGLSFSLPGLLRGYSFIEEGSQLRI